MAGMISWRDNPRYQRLIQKLARMRPDQRAIFDTAMADKEFANEAMQKHLQGLRLAADLQAKDRSYSLASKRLGLRKKMFEENLGFSQKTFGEDLGFRQKAHEAGRGLQQEGIDFDKKQGRLGTYMAAANIPIAAYTGYKSMQRDFDEAEKTRQWWKDALAKMGGTK